MTKQVSKQNIAIAIMAVIIAITMGITFTMAAFSAQATVTGVITFQGDFAIVVYDIDYVAEDSALTNTLGTVTLSSSNLTIGADGYGFGSAKLNVSSASHYYDTTGTITITVTITTTDASDAIDSYSVPAGGASTWTKGTGDNANIITATGAHTNTDYGFSNMISINWDETKITESTTVTFSFAILVEAN